MENIIDSAVLNKIAALLKLAEKNANVNESANAAAMAQVLLSKHRLTVADLDAATNGPREAASVANEPLITGSRISQWKSDLVGQVAKVNGCRYYYSKTFAKYGQGEVRTRREFNVSVRLIGRPSDVAVVRYFYAYLEREIERLSAVAVAGGGITGKSGTNSFKVGAVVAVAKRLNESVKASRDEAAASAEAAGREGCTALVHLDLADREVDEFYNNFTKGFTAKQHSQASLQADAYSQGREAGAGIALNKGLDGKPAKLLN